jgi:hypothetical protein
MDEVSVDLVETTIGEYLTNYNAAVKQFVNKTPAGNKDMLSDLVIKILSDKNIKLVSIIGTRLGREIGFQQELKLLLWFIAEKILLTGRNQWSRISGGAFGSFPDGVKKEIYDRKIYVAKISEADFNGLTVKDIENSI